MAKKDDPFCVEGDCSQWSKTNPPPAEFIVKKNGDYVYSDGDWKQWSDQSINIGAGKPVYHPEPLPEYIARSKPDYKYTDDTW